MKAALIPASAALLPVHAPRLSTLIACFPFDIRGVKETVQPALL